MECLNRLEIQKYLDGEVSFEEKEEFFKHMMNCERCNNLWKNSQLEIESTKELISMLQIEEKEIAIPVFLNPSANIYKRKWVRYSSIAAGIIIILCIYQYIRLNDARIERFAKSKIEAERSVYESDANKLWNEKQSIITIIDADGNLIYSNN